MAKFNGRGIQTTQAAAPKVSDLADGIMQKAFDQMVIDASESVTEGDQVEQELNTPVQTNLNEPTYAGDFGTTESGQVLPASVRLDQSQQGTLNPQSTTNKITNSPIHRNDPTPSSSSNMLSRANKMSDNLTQPGRNNLSINMHPKTESVDALTASYAQEASGVPQGDVDAVREPLLASDEQSNSLPMALHGKLKVFDRNLEGQYQMKPAFAKMISLMAEDEIYNQSMVTPVKETNETGVKDKYEPTAHMEFDEDGNQVYKPELVNPAEGVSKLGSEIEKQWTNLYEHTGGEKPVPMTEQERRDVGAMAIQAYAHTNPDIIKVVPNPDKEVGGDRYELIGIEELQKSAPALSEITDRQVPPLHNAPSTLNKSLDKPLVRGGMKSIRNGRISMDMLEESLENQASISHVVDRQLLKIAAAMVIPTIFRTPGSPQDMWGESFDVGISKHTTLVAREKVLNNRTEEQAVNVANSIIRDKKKDLMKEITSLAMNYGTPNYLTYNIQKLSTRSSPTQTHFNYTRNKVVRYATVGATPTIVIKGKKGKATNNVESVFALLLLEDDMLLDTGRITELELQSKKFSDWGKQLHALITQAFPDEQFDAMVEAIAQGVPLDDPSFPKPEFRKLGEGITPELKKYLDKKGEKAILAIDALIQFNKYYNTPDGASFSTSMTGWVDGKNNGTANGGNMVGSHKLAYLTGVLRDYKSVHALNTQTMDGQEKAVDVAMSMRNLAMEDIEANGIYVEGEKLSNARSQLTDITKIMVNERELNKAISMIFPYGKELQSMKKEVGDHILEQVGKNPNFKLIYDNAIESGQFTHNDVVNVVHHHVTSAVVEIFGDDTFISRGIMRQSSYLMAAMDKGLTIISPAGSEMHLGGNKKDLDKSVDSTVSVKSNEEGGGRSSLNIQTSPTYHSSAASKNDRVAAKGFGRALVMPIHAIDAGAMHILFSGEPWQKIKMEYGKGSPYVRQVYDAVSVDATNYSVVMEELNKGWKDLTLNGWDFYQEMRSSVQRGRKEFYEEMTKRPNDMWSLEPGGRFDFIGALMSAEETDFGGINHATIKSFIRTTYPMVNGVEKEAYNKEVKVRAQYLLDGISKIMGRELGKIDKYASDPTPINSKQVYAIVKLLFDTGSYEQSSLNIQRKFDKQRRELFRSEGIQRVKTGTGSRQYHGG